MPGNEIEITKFLVQNKNQIALPLLGAVRSVGAPSSVPGSYAEINSGDDVDLVCTQDSRKKADIYINSEGVSLKQMGSSNLYNRAQRAELKKIFDELNLQDPLLILESLDYEIISFHEGGLETRDRPWRNFFSEDNFKRFLRFLMMEGGMNVGISSHPAKYILEAPRRNIDIANIRVFDFDGYFQEYQDDIKIAIRRQWVGQASNSEHRRALGLSRKPDNQPWVFNNIVGEPRAWNSSYPDNERKTVYFLMLLK